MKQSSGVSGKSGKYAFGGSVFDGKSAKEVSEEERKQAIQQDQRFQRMTSEKQVPEEKPRKKRDLGSLLLQVSIAVIFAVFIFLVVNNL